MKHAGSRDDLLKQQRPFWQRIAPASPTGQSPLSLVGCLACSLFLVAVVADPIVRDLARSLDASALQALRWVTGFGNSAYSLIAGLVLLGWLAWAKRRRTDLPVEATRDFRSGLILMVGSVAISGFLASLSKNLIGRARPSFASDAGVFDFTPFAFSPGLAAFPSGHATTATSCAVVFALLFPRHAWAWLSIGATAALSRAFLGVHWLSDCLAGMVLGAFVALALHSWMANRGHVFQMCTSVPKALLKDAWGQFGRRLRPQIWD